MLDAVRKALDLSKILTIQDPEYNTLTFEEVFRLATLGGSQGWGTISKHYTVTLFIHSYYFLFFYILIHQSLLWIKLVNSKLRASFMPCSIVALALDDQTGNFEVGKDFDALRVNVAVPGGPIDMVECNGPKVSGGSPWVTSAHA